MSCSDVFPNSGRRQEYEPKETVFLSKEEAYLKPVILQMKNNGVIFSKLSPEQKNAFNIVKNRTKESLGYWNGTRVDYSPWDEFASDSFAPQFRPCLRVEIMQDDISQCYIKEMAVGEIEQALLLPKGTLRIKGTVKE